MNRTFNLRFAIGTIAKLAATIATTGIAQAQSYPTRPITLLVPFAAGSATDTVARLVGTKMSAQLGKPVIIDNLAGAGGTLAATRVARAAPDGYTLLIHTTIALSAVLYKHLDYDTATAFEPIGLINSGPYVLTSRLGYEAKDANEFLASLQEKGEKVSVGQVMEEVRERDKRDRERKVSPLVRAKDAVLVDNTAMGIDETARLIVLLARERKRATA